MKSAIVLLPVLALACYAAPDVYVPWTYPVSGAATFQERNPYQSYMPVQEQGKQSDVSDRGYKPVQEPTAWNAVHILMVNIIHNSLFRARASKNICSSISIFLFCI